MSNRVRFAGLFALAGLVMGVVVGPLVEALVAESDAEAAGLTFRVIGGVWFAVGAIEIVVFAWLDSRKGRSEP